MITSKLTEVEVEGHKYQIRRLDLFQQTRLVAKFGPLVTGMLRRLSATDGETLTAENALSVLFGNADFLDSVAREIRDMPPDDIDYVIKTCFAVVSRQSGSGWQDVLTMDGQVMFEDIGMGSMLKLVRSVVEAHAKGFF